MEGAGWDAPCRVGKSEGNFYLQNASRGPGQLTPHRAVARQLLNAMTAYAVPMLER